MAEDFCVMTFYSTHLALEFERAVKGQGLEVRLIPVPRQISSSCGIAGRFSEDLLERVQELCQQEGIEFENIYRVYGEKSKKPEVLV